MIADGCNGIPWITPLRSHVEQRPIIVLRLAEDELDGILGSRTGISEFTLNRPHRLFQGVRTPSLCLIYGQLRPGLFGRNGTEPVAYLGIVDSRAASATLDTRAKIRRTVRIRPETEERLMKMIDDVRFSVDLAERLAGDEQVIHLSPKLSLHIVDALLTVDYNRAGIRTIAESLHRPKAGSIEGRQLDAVQTALKAFGLVPDAPASELDLATHSSTALGRMRIVEDGAIEHDARVVPGYEFIGSDVTGRATFRKGVQTLEVYTANRRRLEDAFGVDLIYLNLFKQNIVMIQYKMLEPNREEETSDWVYRQDRHILDQVAQMRCFSRQLPHADDYRLNAETFYLKFVRRRASPAKTNVLLPLEHFERIIGDSTYHTRSGNLKVSYNALEGRYMRQTAFFSLLQAGYIGSHATTTAHLAPLVRSVVEGNDAVVVAVQRMTSEREQSADRRHVINSWEVEDEG